MNKSLRSDLPRKLVRLNAVVLWCLLCLTTADAQKRPSPRGTLVSAPQITSFFIDGDNPTTDTCKVGLEVTWDPGKSEPTHFRTSESPTFLNASWKAFTPANPLIHEFHGGPPRFAKGRTVFMQLRKRVRVANTGAYLNYDSTPKSDSIVLLTTCPL